MTSDRRRFQFSLRMFFVILTAFAIWLGGAVNRAREQCETVRAIEALGGTVRFDWQTSYTIWFKGPESVVHHRFGSDSWRPAWMRDLLQQVTEVYFFHDRIPNRFGNSGIHPLSSAAAKFEARRCLFFYLSAGSSRTQDRIA